MPLKLTRPSSPIINLIVSVFFLLCLVLFKFFIPVTSFAQCQTSNLNQGLISATQGLSVDTLFGNTRQVCVTGTPDVSYREFKVPSYQDIEDQFYTFNRSSAKTSGSVPANLAFIGSSSGDGLYLQSGNLTINTSSGTGAQVIFVRGNLDITGNITYADTDSASGLVFIVQGNINIYSTVTQVNAVLISSGIICTAYISGVGCSDGIAYTDPLVINGSLISLNKTPMGGTAIRFARNLEVNNQPAEVINKKAKYLYILRNGLFTRDLVITTEDQHYPITTNSTPALSVNGSCSPTPSTGDLPNPSTTWKFTGSIAGSGIYNYSWTGSDGLSQSSTSSTAAKTYTLSGPKTASVVITDLGNPSTPASQPVICSNFTVRAITVTCSRTTPADPVYTGSQVTWTAYPNPATPPSGIYTYSWSLGDGFTSTSNPATATYSTAGSKTATVTLTNDTYTTPVVNCTPNPLTVNTLPPAPTITACTANTSGPVANGGSITWNATTANGVGPFNYNWTVTNNTPTYSTGATASTTKSFSTGGNKTATVTVTDSFNRTSPSFTCTPTPIFVNYPYYRVFVSTTPTYSGNLVSAANALSPAPSPLFTTSSGQGLLAGNFICQRLANTAGYGGVWRAWLSTSTSNAKDRLLPTNTSLPFRRVDGTTTIASNWAAFLNAGSVSFSNLISTVTNQKVITGTKETGVYADSTGNINNPGDDCSGYTSTSGTVRNGDNAQLDQRWTSAGGQGCNQTYYHLYCIEQ